MRRPRVLPLIGAVFLALPVLEVVLIIWVGHQIGAGWTLLLVLAGVPLGVWIIKRAGRRSLRAMAEGIRQGRPTTDDLAHTGWFVIGGILLMVPGFITDVVAVAVMIPFTRGLLGRALAPVHLLKRTWVPPASTGHGSDAEPTVVQGDVL